MSSNLSQILPIVSLGLLSVICMVCGKDRLITASTKSLWILFVCFCIGTAMKLFLFFSPYFVVKGKIVSNYRFLWNIFHLSIKLIWTAYVGILMF